MKISIAQIQPISGDIKANIINHLKWIHEAINQKADLIVFPELSITGYEPKLARNLAVTKDDVRFNVFQTLSNTHQITIGIGAPLLSDSGIQIGMIFFNPNRARTTYSKQILHVDEFPYFVKGNSQHILTINQINIAPAICYESLQSNHIQQAKQLNAHIYIASVAKHNQGIEKANTYFSQTAKKHNIPILLSNAIGACDNFISHGQSAIWNAKGVKLSQLNTHEEGLLSFDITKYN